MIKVSIFLVIFFVFSVNVFAIKSIKLDTLNTIDFEIKGKTVSGEKLYNILKIGLDKKYLDPSNKMNFVNNLIVKLD
jgi:hypothetical protein